MRDTNTESHVNGVLSILDVQCACEHINIGRPSTRQTHQEEEHACVTLRHTKVNDLMRVLHARAIRERRMWCCFSSYVYTYVS